MALIEEHFADRNETAEVMNLSGDKAQSFIDVIDEVLFHLPNEDWSLNQTQTISLLGRHWIYCLHGSGDYV